MLMAIVQGIDQASDVYSFVQNKSLLNSKKKLTVAVDGEIVEMKPP
jgi:hypothetical protein